MSDFMDQHGMTIVGLIAGIGMVVLDATLLHTHVMEMLGYAAAGAALGLKGDGVWSRPGILAPK